MASWYFLYEFSLPTISGVMDIYGQSFQYDPKLKKVLHVNGQRLLSDMHGNRLGFTKEQIASFGLKEGSLLKIGKGNKGSLEVLTDSGIEPIFRKAYKEEFDREY